MSSDIKILPLTLRAEGLTVLVVGGGEVATRKVKAVLISAARVTVIAPAVTRKLKTLSVKGRIRHLARPFQAGDCQGFGLVIAATPDRQVNEAVYRDASTSGALINVVDTPDLCTVYFPAVWNEGLLTVAVSSSGEAPFLAAAIRDVISSQHRSLARWTQAGADFRRCVRGAGLNRSEQTRLLRWFADLGPLAEGDRYPRGENLNAWLTWLAQREKAAHDR